MSKLPDYSSQDKAFLMYSAGIKPADIAKELGVTPNTITSWKKHGNWDDKIIAEGNIPQQVISEVKELSVDKSKINKVIEDIIIHAIEVDGIRPTKWKDILDTLAFLSRGFTKGDGARAKGMSRPIEDLPDHDLDKEIEALNSLVNIEKEEAEIIVYKNGAIKTE